MTNIEYAPFGGPKAWQHGNGVWGWQLMGEYGYPEGSKKIAALQEHIWLDGQPIGMVKDGALYHVISGHLGEPNRLMDGAGNVVWEAKRTAFGLVKPVVQAVEYNLGLPGQYFDKETGLFFNNARVYDPKTGKFTSPDPLGQSGGDANLYPYVGSDPLRNVDAWGLQTVMPMQSTPLMTPITGAPTIPWNLQGPDISEKIRHLSQMAEVGSQVVSNLCNNLAETLEPPGNCTPDEHRMLQDNVENQCGAAKACSGNDKSAEILNQKIGQQSRWIDARERINDRCFDGGNKRHNIARNQRVNAIRNCQDFLTQLGLK